MFLLIRSMEGWVRERVVVGKEWREWRKVGVGRGRRERATMFGARERSV